MSAWGDPTAGPTPPQAGIGTAGPDAPTMNPPASGITSAHAPPAYASPPGYGDAPSPGFYQPGQVVAGDLKIIAKIGQGGMGAVYRAKHLLLDREVAIKIHHSTSEDDAYRVEREAKAMARLKHPNVVGIWDVRRDGDALIITMEYLPNGTLRDAVNRVRTWQERLELCLQAGDGLAAAHAAGLVHRDFKPDNVLIDRDGKAVVGDFGLARAPGPLEPSSPSRGPIPTPSDLDGELTATGAVMGTPAYMAPEQYEGSKVDARADQFAFCIVLYEALYGRRPFPGQSLSEILYSISTGAMVMPPPDTDVPDEIWQLIRKGLSTRPEDRHRSMGALLGEIRSMLRAPGQRWLVLAISLAAAFVLVAAGVVYGVLHEIREGNTRLLMNKAFNVEVKINPPPVVVPSLDEAVAQGLANEEARRKRVEELLARAKADPNAIRDPALMTELAGLMEGNDFEQLEAMLALAASGMAQMDTERTMPSAERTGEAFRIGAWDGRSTFECAMGEEVELRGVTAVIESGPAIEAGNGCKIHIVDCEIEADVIVTGTMAAEVRIEGGSFRARQSLVSVTMLGTLAVVDAKMETRSSGPAIDLDMNTSARIERSTIWGDVGIKSQMRNKVTVKDSRIIGETASIDAGMHTSVQLDSSELDGPVKKSMHVQIEDVTLESK